MLGPLANPSPDASDAPALEKNGPDCAYPSIWTPLDEVDSGVPDNDVDAGRIVVLPYLGDLPECVGCHGDQVLAAPAANVPQRGDLDLLPRWHDGGIDDPKFPVDVGAAHPDPRGGLVGKGVTVVVEDGGQLGNIRDDLGVVISRAPTGVAYFDQTHDQIR